MNTSAGQTYDSVVSAGCHINDVMNFHRGLFVYSRVSAGCHINDVMNC